MFRTRKLFVSVCHRPLYVQVVEVDDLLEYVIGKWWCDMAVTQKELLDDLFKRHDDGDGKLSATELRDCARAAPGGLLAYVRELRGIWFAEGDGGRGDTGGTPTPPATK